MSIKFNPPTDIRDLSEKTILVTGGNAGIGKATVEALAAHNPKCLYLCCRKMASGEAVVQSIHEQHTQANIQVLPLDLSDFESVKACASEVQRRCDRLDILILNAGVSSTPHQTTKQGYEYQFGVNHLGHALLTQLLMPKLLHTQRTSASKDIRIVVVASKGAFFAPEKGLSLDTMKTSAASTNVFSLYGNSKLANIMFARKLAQLYPDITSTSVHPGTVKSEIWGKADGAGWLFKNVFAPVLNWFEGVTNEEGAKTQLWAATAETGRGKGAVENGRFYDPVGQLNWDGKFARDASAVDELWRWTDEELKAHGGPGWPAAEDRK